MSRGAWWGAVHGAAKESDMTKATKQQQQRIIVKGGALTPLPRAPALLRARQMLQAGGAGDAWSMNRTGPARVELTSQWSLGCRVQKVIKDTDCEIDNLMATRVTEKINGIMREWMGRG